MGSQPIKGTYSASRVSAIIGLNSYQTPFNIFQTLMEENEPDWNKKHGYELPEFVDTPATRWGHAFEDSVIKLAEDKSGDVIKNREKPFTKSYFPKDYFGKDTNPNSNFTLSCHIDGAYQNMDNGLVIHEGKTTNSRAFYSSKTEIEESLDDDGQVLKDFKIVKKWGEPGTDQVPMEYQVQAAVQRICTNSDLVKLLALVFPDTPDNYEALGWECGYNLFRTEDGYIIDTADYDVWAESWAQQGNLHVYNLPSHPELEQSIIKAVQEFHENHILTGLPPRAQNYDDIKRLLASPQGTIIATDQIKKLANEYSELTRQLGASSPNAKRRDAVKIELLNLINESKRDDYINPPDKISVLDPNGGAELVKFGQDKNGNLRFTAKRAK